MVLQVWWGARVGRVLGVKQAPQQLLRGSQMPLQARSCIRIVCGLPLLLVRVQTCTMKRYTVFLMLECMYEGACLRLLT